MHLRDQVRRAVSSIALNIAEGADEFRRPEKARFYRIARRSAGETVAGLDLIDGLRVEGLDTASYRSRLSEIAAMLTLLIRSLESR